MAGHNNHNKKQQPDNNFFSQNIQKFGEDFLDMITPRDMTFAAANILRGLAKGRINLDKYGEYFLDPRVIEPILNYANGELSAARISLNGVNLLISTMQMQGMHIDLEVFAVSEKHKKLMEAYTMITNGLIALRMTGDVNILYIMSTHISSYRNNI